VSFGLLEQRTTRPGPRMNSGTCTTSSDATYNVQCTMYNIQRCQGHLGGPGGSVGGRKKKGSKVGCRVFRREGVGLTGKAEVVDGFCEFYSQVGPKLMAKIRREREREPSWNTWATESGSLSLGGLQHPWRWRSCVVPWIHIKVWAGMKSPCDSSKRWLGRFWAPCPVCLTAA
jgi:hypothetical protein